MQSMLETSMIRVYYVEFYQYRYRYWYRYIGIGMETFQTDTDSWILIHTDTGIYRYVTDILVCYRFFLILHRYYLKKSVSYRYNTLKSYQILTDSIYTDTDYTSTDYTNANSNNTDMVNINNDFPVSVMPE